MNTILYKIILVHLVFINLLHAEEKVNVGELKKQYVKPHKVPYLEGNAYSKEREELGKMLFFDPRISGSNVMSCATCHNPSFGWSDAQPKAVGHGHKTLGRKTPTILNLAWTEKMMWDGRFSHLEGQALGPIGSEAEMNGVMIGEHSFANEIKSIKGYQDLFAKAYPKEEITADLIAKAIAVFERGVVSSDAPFDKWIKGNNKAISEEAIQGFVLFNTKAKCATCHSGWSFSDGSFHDIGVNDDDIGRGKFLKLKSQQHAFKTPGLRNINQRAPYMHGGSESTLEEVVDFYNQGGKAKRESLSDSITPLNLSDKEKKSLVAFLHTLTSRDKEIGLPILPR